MFFALTRRLRSVNLLGTFKPKLARAENTGLHDQNIAWGERPESDLSAIG